MNKITQRHYLNTLFTLTLAVICLPLGLQAQDYEYTIENGEGGGISTQSATHFGPYPIIDGHSDTGDLMGLLYTLYAPWVYCNQTECWYYIQDEVANASCGWIYVPSMPALEAYPPMGYTWSYKLKKWLYIDPKGSGWVYLF